MAVGQLHILNYQKLNGTLFIDKTTYPFNGCKQKKKI
jgi:hypothetical protein